MNTLDCRTSAGHGRAYRSSIIDEILAILRATAKDYEEHGDPESDLRDAPEYIINVNLAQGLTHRFKALRYRLEHHASAFEGRSLNSIDVRKALQKQSARFDIVLINESNNVPRYIIEVKRGTKILGDAKRILSVAALDSGRLRWSHGFLVTILRRTEEDTARQVATLTQAIRDIDTHELGGARNHRVRVKAGYRWIGDSRQNQLGKALYAAVFQITLVSDDETAILATGTDADPPSVSEVLATC